MTLIVILSGISSLNAAIILDADSTDLATYNEITTVRIVTDELTLTTDLPPLYLKITGIQSYGIWTGINNFYLDSSPGSTEPFGNKRIDEYTWQITWQSPVVNPVPIPGYIADFEYMSNGPSLCDVQVTLFDNQFHEIDSLCMSQTPEPYSFFILGLGAIIARRKILKGTVTF